MNCSEIFRKVADFKTTEQMVYFEWGYWLETIERWKSEGMGSLEELHNELGMCEARWCGVCTHVYPAFSSLEIIEDKGDTVIVRDWNGTIAERPKNGATRFPKFIEFPVKDRKSYYKWREERLNPNDPGRLDDYLKGNHPAAVDRNYILWGGGKRDGFFGWPRDLIGLEGFMMMLFEDPGLIHEINRDHLELVKTAYSKVLPNGDFDFMFIWEDMSYNKGMLISPAMVKEFMLPYYRELIAFYKSYGYNKFFVDSDGNVDELIGLLTSVGVNGMLPFEVAAGEDVTEVRKKFPNFVIFGGIDKMEIAKGPAAIDRELERVIPFMKKHGGYFPTLDHHVNPEISLRDFKHYRKRIAQYWNS